MSDDKTLSERIDALETRLMFQDETIETLNKTITAQWQQIDALTRQFAEHRASGCRRPRPAARATGQRTAAALLIGQRNAAFTAATQTTPR